MALAIFDLDGTLIDSARDLVGSVNATLHEMNRPALAPEVVSSYIGGGAPLLIRRVLGEDIPEADFTHALQFFLAHYREHCVDHTVFYPGILAALERMHAAGVHLAVLTNKPVRISQLIMQRLNAAHFMYRIYGGNSFEHKKPHRIGIDTLRSECPGDHTVTWMVGDTPTDILTARNAGVLACGVAWGFQPESFTDYPPDLIVTDLDQLADAIL